MTISMQSALRQQYQEKLRPVTETVLALLKTQLDTAHKLGLIKKSTMFSHEIWINFMPDTTRNQKKALEKHIRTTYNLHTEMRHNYAQLCVFFIKSSEITP